MAFHPSGAEGWRNCLPCMLMIKVYREKLLEPEDLYSNLSSISRFSMQPLQITKWLHVKDGGKHKWQRKLVGTDKQCWGHIALHKTWGQRNLHSCFQDKAAPAEDEPTCSAPEDHGNCWNNFSHSTITANRQALRETLKETDSSDIAKWWPRWGKNLCLDFS